MPDITIHVDCQVSCATADVTHGHTHLTFLIGQHNLPGSQGVKHKLLDLNTCRAYTLTQVINCHSRSSNDMCFHFAPIRMHSFWIADTILTIHTNTALDHMDDFAIMWDRYRTRLIEGMSYIELLDAISIARSGASAVD